MTDRHDSCGGHNRVTFVITYFLVVTVSAVVAGSMIWIYNTGYRMSAVHGPLVNAAMEIRLEASEAHLWLEEAVGGDTSIDINDVLSHIDIAKIYAEAMLEGSDSPGMEIVGLTDPQMQSDIGEVVAELDSFRDITVRRWNMESGSGSGSEIDQEYDAVFARLLGKADTVGDGLRMTIAEDLRNFTMLQLGLVVLCLGTMSTVGISFGRLLSRRVRDGEQLLASNRHLDASNQQLQAAQQQLQKANQQLEAINQQLRAGREELAVRNRFLSNVLESVKHPFYVIDPDDFSIEMANSASEFTPDSGRGYCHQLTHGSDTPCTTHGMACPVEEIRRTKRPVTVEHEYTEANGEVRFVEIHAYPVLDSEGNVARIIESVIDITERKLAHQKIEGLAKFPSENPNPVMRVAGDGVILFANKACQFLRDSWHCREGDKLPQAWLSLAAEALEVEKPVTAELCCDQRWLSLTFAAVADPGYVNIYGLDITAQKTAQREVEELAKFPAENPNPVVRVIRGGRIVYANKASERLLDSWGCKIGDILPKPWQNTVAQALDRDETAVTNVQCQERSLSLSFAPIVELSYVNIYGLDTTERVRAEQEKRQAMTRLEHTSRLITVGEMASGVAHELNQPLCAILNYANTCLRTMQSPNASPDILTKAIQEIALQADRSGGIIRRLRALVAKHDTLRTPTSVNDVVRGVLKLQAGEATQRSVTVTTELAEDVPLVPADTVQIEQVLLNFVRNAFDAVCGSADTPTVTVRTAVSDNSVEVTVSDNGTGLVEGEHEKVFESFYTTKPDGLGIGLSLSRTIIEAHRGSIRAKPNDDGGASFTFTLPTEV